MLQHEKIRAIRPWEKGFKKHSLSETLKSAIGKRTRDIRARNKRTNHRLPMWVLESISNTHELTQ